MTGTPKRDDFAEQIGTNFEICLDSEKTIELKLIEVDEVKKTNHFETFSIAFLAPGVEGMATQIYKLKHKKMGEIELFLSPFSKDDDGLKLESVFNLAAQN